MPIDAPPGVAICIPVRNEAARLPRLFDAIDALERVGGRPAQLCLLLDGCTDDSAGEVARYRAQSFGMLTIGEAPASLPNAGIARHRAMMLGVAALGADGGILLTTDADSLPAPDWVAVMLAALDHADVVAGAVVRATTQACAEQDRIDAYYARLFALRRHLDPVPWEARHVHHHTSGANMGMRTDTYALTGGFPPIVSGEDARFVDDAMRAGLRVRRDADSVVYTSDRRDGRAAGGLAQALRDLDRGGLAGVTVAHPADSAWQYRAQAVARDAFAGARLDDLVAMVGLDMDHLVGVARDCRNAEAFAMRVVPAPPGGMRHVPFPVAEAALAALLDPCAEVRAA